MYYLQSRYYDPQVGRFINADEFASTGQGVIGYDMFVYCGNNPVNMQDPNGELALGALLTKVAIGAAVGGFVDAVCVFSTTGSLSEAGEAFAKGALAGAVSELFEPLSYVCIAINAYQVYDSCIDSGASVQASLFAAGAAVVAGLSFGSLDSKAIDLTLGLGASLTATCIEEGVSRSANRSSTSKTTQSTKTQGAQKKQIEKVPGYKKSTARGLTP